VKNHSAWTLWTSSARTAAPAPSSSTATRTSRRMPAADGAGRRNREQQFHANIDPADRMEALKLEVTAPMIAPRPSTAIHAGVR